MKHKRTFEVLERRVMFDGHLTGALAEVTQKIADLNPNGAHANITSFAVRDDGTLSLSVAARQDVSLPTAEISLWTTDGSSESTSKIADVEESGAISYESRRMVTVGNSVYFFVNRREVPPPPPFDLDLDCTFLNSPDLYLFDGSSDSPTLVSTFFSTCSNESVFVDYSLKPIDDQRVLVLESRHHTGTIKTDLRLVEGTRLATTPLAQFRFDGHPISEQVELKGDLWFGGGFSEGNSGLSRLDLKTLQVEVIRRFQPISLFGLRAASDLVPVNDQILFRANDGDIGFELWRSDGSAEGTRLVKDIDPTPFEGSHPRYLTNVNGTVFFFASTPEYGYELWKTDATEEGTVLVRDIVEGPESAPFVFARFNERTAIGVEGLFYFALRNANQSLSVWRSNGTADGTFELVNVGRTVDIVHLEELDGRLYFSVGMLFSQSTEQQIWMTDGSIDGTQLAIEYESVTGQFATVGERLVFPGSDEEGDVALWSIEVPENLRADIDNNGVVDFKDFLILSEKFGDEVDGGKRDGDLDRDGVIDFSDFLILARGYNG